MTGSTAKAEDNRPLSPFFIYKPQITSVLSITHRLTGIALYVGMLLLAWWIVCSVYISFTPSGYISPFWKFFTTPVGYVLLVGWSFALFYHVLNGIRHLFWDAGKGFDLKTVTASGIAVVLGAVVLTGLSWLLAFI